MNQAPALTQLSDWYLHKPRIAMRIGLIGTGSAVQRVLAISSEDQDKPLNGLFSALRKTLSNVLVDDKSRQWPKENIVPFLAVLTRATQRLGYRVDKASLSGQSTTVYESSPPLLRIRTIEGSLGELIRKWQEDRKEVDTEIETVGISGKNTTFDPAREESYAFSLLLHHSDLLVAVWDSENTPERIRIDGLMRKAIRERMDVLAIRITPSGNPIVAIIDTERELDLLHYGEVADDIALKSIATNEKLSEVDLSRLEKQWVPTYEFPDAWSNEKENQIVSGAVLYHPRAAFLKLVRNDPPRKSMVAYWFWQPYKWFTRTSFHWFHRKHLGDHSPSDIPEPVVRSSACWSERISKVQKISDDPFSRNHGETYRGGIVASYVLAILAVVLAGLGGWSHVGHTGEEHGESTSVAAESLEEHGHDEHQAMSGESSSHGSIAIWSPVTFGFLELGLVVWMFMLSLWSSKRGWRIQFTESRMLAEATRVWEILGTMGLHTPMPNLPHYLKGDYVAPNAEATWSLWYFRALVRQAPIYLDAEFEKRSYASQTETLRYLASNQIQYHSTNAEQQSYVHELIETLSTYLFLAVLGCVVWHLVELITGNDLHASYGIAICIGGPFLIALLHGFESQMEIQRLRQRSSSVRKLLETRLAEIERLQNRVEKQGEFTIEDRWHLLREGLETGSILIDETAGWSMLYRARDIHAG